jgi:hypothetical protein
MPPVLPHDLVKLSAANSICRAHQHTYCLQHSYSVNHIDVIADKHKLLLHAYHSEPILKQVIDGLDGQSSFRDGWGLIGSRFPNLMEFCGILATIFPGTSTVELDFSVLRWEKDNFCKSLLDFGLEGVMQSKQWTFLKQFEQ